MKHLALFSFLILLAATVSVSLLFFRSSRRTAKMEDHLFGMMFFFGSFSLILLYTAEYIVLNIVHTDTVLYASLEAAAFGLAIFALWFFSRAVASAGGREKAGVFIPSLFIITGVMLVFCRLSNHLFGYHPPFFNRARTASLVLLGCMVLVESVVLLLRARGDRIRVTMSVALLLLPPVFIMDVLLIRFKLYEGAVRLGMSYPLLVSVYLLICGILTALLYRRLKAHRDSRPSVLTLAETFRLTKREKEIIFLIAEGKSNKNIADILFISLTTVKNHVHSIFRKMNIPNRYELIKLVLSDSEK